MRYVFSSLLLFSAFTSMEAYSQISSNFTVTSDYVWRGQTQTNHDAAIQGGMDYQHESGISVGAWGSNVNAGTPGTEVDLYGRYTHAFNDNFSVFLGSTFYHYTRHSGNDAWEWNTGLSAFGFNLTANYMDEYLGIESSSWYFSLSHEFNLLKEKGVSLGLHVGLTTFENEDNVGSKNYMDYRINLNRTMNDFTFGFFYTDTNRKSTVGDIDQEDEVFGLAVSHSF